SCGTGNLAFGARGGKGLAVFGHDKRTPRPSIRARGGDEQGRIEEQFLRKTAGRERIATLRAEMQQTVEEAAGIYRTGTTLEKAAEKLHSLQERFHDVALDRSYTFNTELTAALELSYMLD